MLLKPFQDAIEKASTFEEALTVAGVTMNSHRDLVKEMQVYWDALHGIVNPSNIQSYKDQIIKCLSLESQEIVKNGGLALLYNDEVTDELKTTPEAISPWFAWRGTCVAVFTREKQGKSTILTADAATAGYDGQKVLWITAEEDITGITTRIDRYKKPNTPRVPILVSPLWPDSVDEIRVTLDAVRPDYVIIDSLTSMIRSTDGVQPDNSNTAAWASYVLQFKQMAMEFNCAVVILHHANKGNGEYIGSVGIGMSVDGLIKVTRSRKAQASKKAKKSDDYDDDDAMMDIENVSRINYERCRWMDDSVRYLNYDPKTGIVTEDLNSFLEINAESVLYEFLKTGPKTSVEVDAHFTANDISKSIFYKVKNNMKLARIKRGGKYELPADYNPPNPVASSAGEDY